MILPAGGTHCFRAVQLEFLTWTLITEDEALLASQRGTHSIALTALAMITALSSAVLQFACNLEWTAGLLEIHALKLKTGTGYGNDDMR